MSYSIERDKHHPTNTVYPRIPMFKKISVVRKLIHSKKFWNPKNVQFLPILNDSKVPIPMNHPENIAIIAANGR